MKAFRFITVLILILNIVIFSAVKSNSQIIQNKRLLSKIDSMLIIQKRLAISNKSEIFDIFIKNMSADAKSALSFIVAFSPLSDLADYSSQFMLDNVEQSLKAKRETLWGNSIPEEVFVHFVLPIRVNNENLDSFRLQMYDEIYSRVKDMGMYSAALEVNHWCHEKVTYRASDARTSSPLASVKYSFGRCGEESTLLVAALRTVGIPARQVYTPRWAHTDDNHAWVEVWVDGKWYFMGACEPSPELNMGWFALPSTRTMLVHTRAYGPYFGSETIITKADRFTELNLIANYAPYKDIYIKVIDRNNTPVENALVKFKLYNYAEFYPLAKVFTNKSGLATFRTGLGDLLVWANKSKQFGFAKISIPDTDTLVLTIRDEFPNGKIIDFDMNVPAEGNIVQASQANAKTNEQRLLYEDSIRSQYMQSFLDSNSAAKHLTKLNIQDVKLTKYLVNSYGNHSEIFKFITDTKPENIQYAVKLLSVISEKDLRDTRAEILSGHLNSALKFRNVYKNNEDIWVEYVLNGRIANEMMTDFREIGDGVLQNWKMKKINQLHYSNELRYIMLKGLTSANVRIDTIANAHSRAPITPLGVYKLKVADPISRDIFYVALCRSLGLAARINPLTSKPQIFINSLWADADLQSESVINTQKGYVKFINKSSFDPKYYINFTLEHFNNGDYNTLEFDDIKPLSAFADSIEVPIGNYMLVCGNRKPDGSVLTRCSFFEVKEKEFKTVDVDVRDLTKQREVWAELKAEDYKVQSVDNEQVSNLSEIIGNDDYILAFIEPDKEPSKHIMADLESVKMQLESTKAKIIFILEKGKAQDDFRPSTYYNLPKNISYVWDLDSQLIKHIESLKKLELLNDFPIIISAGKDSKLDFFTKGYRIGIGDDLLKSISNRK